MKDEIVDIEKLILRLYFSPEYSDPKDTHETIKAFAKGLGFEFAKQREEIENDFNKD